MNKYFLTILLTLSFQTHASQAEPVLIKSDLVPGASITMQGNQIFCTEGAHLKVKCGCVQNGNFSFGDSVTFEVPKSLRFAMFHLGSAYCAQIRNHYVAFDCKLMP